MDATAQTDEFAKLKAAIVSPNLPSDLAERLTQQLERLEKAVISQGYKIEFDKDLDYIKFIIGLPFDKSSQDILDLSRAQQILDKNHYGLQGVKQRILEYLSVLILRKQAGKEVHSSILAFVGLVGSGKTSLAYSIAEALGRRIIRIPFGGLGSANLLRGTSRIQAESEPGLIMKSISREGVNNPVILLDEIDRVTEGARADVMGVLVELLDPEQNNSFLDHYLDYPFDLSKVLFIATANNTGNIATAVMDRLEVIEMPSYSDDEKIIIGKNYLLPRAIAEAGLTPQALAVDDNLWPQIVRPLGFDAGIRSLQRNIQSLVRKVALSVVEGKPGPYHLNQENIGQFLS
ncbi:AAA family ATPase [Candidatus Daviesbacteria bacterium]|nr:AAA family ATPase [Candidatus Daviesbacteria bacterium]